MESNCKPPKKRRIVTIEVQPEVGLPIIKVLTTIKNIKIKDTRHTNPPTKKDMLSGASEKLIIPSSEYLNRDQKLHEVLPATRSILVYSKYLVLKLL